MLREAHPLDGDISSWGLTNLIYVLKYVHKFVANYVIIIVITINDKKWCEMLRTTNISTLRTDLSTYLSDLENGPILVLSHSQPKAVLVDPELFNALVEKVEMLEDLVDGRRALAEYSENPDNIVNAEEVFERLGY
jgi:PHD/YefM family antitoxin component YafN of YafNO toxin-antitoxin module